MLWRYHILIRCLRAEEDRSLHGWAVFKDVIIIFVFYNCSSKGCCELIDSRAISPSHPHLYFYCVELKNFKFISTLQRNSWIPATMLVSSAKIPSHCSPPRSWVPVNPVMHHEENCQETEDGSGILTPNKFLHPTPSNEKGKKKKKDKVLSRILKIPKGL